LRDALSECQKRGAAVSSGWPIPACSASGIVVCPLLNLSGVGIAGNPCSRCVASARRTTGAQFWGCLGYRKGSKFRDQSI